MGHAVISYCHDPDNKFREAYGVLGEPATALRDPVFYRWCGSFELLTVNILSLYTDCIFFQAHNSKRYISAS